MKIGILTGGGDAPGLNAVIRAVVKSGAYRGDEIVGFDDGFRGLVEPNRWRSLTPATVAGILREGGTILGTTNQAKPASYPTPGGGVADRSADCVDHFHDLSLDALIVVGGDGTLTIARDLYRRGIPIVGVPKTIDNDVVETQSSIGFDTAANVATDAVDRLHSTADAHHRNIVVEVMGRYAGWIALQAGIAGGADVILIPEIPYRIERVAAHLAERERRGARFSIIVVAEGARPVGGQYSLAKAADATLPERLGGVGAQVAAAIETMMGREARSVLLGHLQRGGPPTSLDRVLATRLGARAMELVACRQFGVMVALRPPDLCGVPLSCVAGRTRLVSPTSDTVLAARAIGIGFGD